MDALSLVWPALALVAAGSLVTAWIAEHLPDEALAKADEGRYAGLGTVQAAGGVRASVALPAAGMLNTSR